MFALPVRPEVVRVYVCVIVDRVGDWNPQSFSCFSRIVPDSLATIDLFPRFFICLFSAIRSSTFLALHFSNLDLLFARVN